VASLRPVKDPPVEDQAGAVRAAQVEVVVDQLVEEDPPGQRPVQHLGEGELGLQHGDVVLVAGGLVVGGERVRQPSQPLEHQRLDLLRAQPVTDGLHRARVGHRGEGVVQRRDPDAGLGRLPLGVLVAVEAHLRVVREVGGELDEERAEVGVHRVDVELVDHRGVADQPRVGLPGHRVPAGPGPPHPGLLLRPAHEQHPLGQLLDRAAGRRGRLGQVRPGDVVLALPLAQVHQVQAVDRHVVVQVGHERVGDRFHQHRRGVAPAALLEEVHHPRGVLQPRLEHVQQHPVDRLDLEHHVIGQHPRQRCAVAS
jgi:hypothetical protein